MNEKIEYKKINFLVNTIAVYDNRLILLKDENSNAVLKLPEKNRLLEKGNLGLLQKPYDCAYKCFKEKTGLDFLINDILGCYSFKNESNNFFNKHLVVYGTIKNISCNTGSNIVMIDLQSDIFSNPKSDKLGYKINKDHYQLIKEYVCLNRK